MTEQSKKLTEPHKKILDAVNSNSAFSQPSQLLKTIASLPKVNTEGVTNVLSDAFKNENLKGSEKVQRTIPDLVSGFGNIDNRNRAERKEYFETKMLEIDQEKIILLIDVWKKIQNNNEITPDEVSGLKEDTINTLIKYQRTINMFKELNSDLAVQLDYKKNELKFIIHADWKKWLKMCPSLVNHYSLQLAILSKNMSGRICL